MSYRMILSKMKGASLGGVMIAVLLLSNASNAHGQSQIGNTSNITFETMPIEVKAVRLSSSQARPAFQTFSFVVDPTTQPDSQPTGIRVPANAFASIIDTSGTWSCASNFSEVGIRGHKKSIRGSLKVSNAPLCALIGKIGRGQWQTAQELSSGDLGFQAGTSGGMLYLAANDIPARSCTTFNDPNGCYLENTGEIEVTIEIVR